MKRGPLNGPPLRDGVRRRPRRALLIVALSLLAVAVGGYLAAPQLRARHHLNQARVALDNGDFEQALAELNKCREIWPDDADVHRLSARAQRLAGNISKSIEELRACKDSGGDAESIAFETQLLDATQGKLAAVETNLRRQIDNGHPDKRFIFEALIRGYLIRQRSEEAERLATTWIELLPSDWQPHFLRAIARTKMTGELATTPFDGAKKDYERVLELKPDHDLARLLLGNAYALTGQYREALPHLERYCQQKPDDVQGVTELANCYRALGQIDDASRVLDDWLAKHAGNVDVYLLRGQVAMDVEKSESALDFFHRAEALAPGQEKTQYLLAVALRALGRAEEANPYEEKWRTYQELTAKLKQLAQVAAREPQNLAVRYEAGTIALRLGDDANGVRWLQSALKLDPNHRPTHAALAEHFQRKGNYQAAAAHRELAGGSPR